MTPVASKVIFERLPDAEVTASGLHLPNNGVKRYSKGRVIAAPLTYIEQGVERVVPFTTGDLIVYVSQKCDKLDHTSQKEVYWVEVHNVIFTEHA